jgi:hypothetical protein
MANLKTKAGTELTEERLKQLADEAQRGYDLSTAKRVRARPGRPSLAEGESPRISYRIPASLFDAAASRAKAEGRTLSELAREALRRYLAD